MQPGIMNLGKLNEVQPQSVETSLPSLNRNWLLSFEPRLVEMSPHTLNLGKLQ